MMEWLVESVNHSVNLEQDFPYVQWMAFKDFAQQAALLASWGGEGGLRSLGCELLLSVVRLVS